MQENINKQVTNMFLQSNILLHILAYGINGSREKVTRQLF